MTEAPFPRIVYEARRVYWEVSPGVFQATSGVNTPPRGTGGYAVLASLCALKGDPKTGGGLMTNHLKAKGEALAAEIELTCQTIAVFARYACGVA